MLNLDPFALDRTIARFADQRERFLARLVTGEDQDHTFEDLPPGLDAELLSTLERAKAQDPLAFALSEWVRFLLHEHASLGALRQVTAAFRIRHRIDDPERAELSIYEMRQRLVSDYERGAEWQQAISSRASALSSRRLAYFDLRNDLGARLGMLAPEWVASLGELGGAIVMATDDAFAELRPRSLGDLARHGLGRDAPGDYPQRMTPRALSELLSERAWLHGIDPKLGELPAGLGPASFGRALDQLGRALHDAGASAKQPFVMARDPKGLRRAEFGALFALLLQNPAFALHKLGVDRTRLRDHLRVMSRVALVTVRVAIARTALALASRAEPRAYRQAFEIVVPRATGCELPISLAGVVLVDEDAPHHFAALLTAVTRSRDLIERHDQDWFRDPRVVEELRGELESPPPREANLQSVADGAEILTKTIGEHW